MGNSFSRAYTHHARQATQQAKEESQRLQPRQEVIDLYTQAAERYQQAADVHNSGDSKRANYLSNSAENLSGAALEAQTFQPRQEVIDQHLRKAEGERNRANTFENTSFCIIS